MPQEAARPSFDNGVPTVARVYDYVLGGKDNYAADREVGEAILSAIPQGRQAAVYNREILERAVRHLTAEEGIDQFLDLGSGLPTARNTHEVAHEIDPGAAVVYVDIDPLVSAHGHAILADNPDTRVVTGDVRDPAAVLAHADVRALIDFDRPVCVMLVGLLHHILDAEDPNGIVATLRDAVAPGSYFLITNFTRYDDDDPKSKEFEQLMLGMLGTGRVRSEKELMRFFDGMELLPPGLVPLPLWRPDRVVHEPSSLIARGLTGGLARVPVHAV